MRRPIILIYNPHPALQGAITSMLGKDYSIRRIDAVDEVYEWIDEGPCVFINHVPSDASPIETIRSLKAAVPGLPVVLTGTSFSESCIIAAFRSGAEDVLVQPFERDELLACLLRIVLRDRQSIFRRVLNRLAAWLNPGADTTKHRTAGDRRRPTAVHPEDRIPESNHKARGGRRAQAINRPAESRPSSIYLPDQTIITSAGRVDDRRAGESGLSLNGFLLGPFQVVLNGVLIESWPHKKGRSLFAYLLYHHRDKNLRDVLMEKFWPGLSMEGARNNLNVTLHRIRNLLHQVDASHEHILFKDDSYIINPEVELQLDHERFLQRWRRAKKIERESGIKAALAEYENAVALYKGDFFEDDPYEDWPSAERENIKEVYLFILDRLSSYHGSCSNYPQAITLCKTILEKDDCREDIHCRLMLFLYRTGHRDLAIRQYQKCFEALKTELGVHPGKSTLVLLEQIKREGSHFDERQLNLNVSDY